jgi:hypothetical protein
MSGHWDEADRAPQTSHVRVPKAGIGAEPAHHFAIRRFQLLESYAAVRGNPFAASFLQVP